MCVRVCTQRIARKRFGGMDFGLCIECCRTLLQFFSFCSKSLIWGKNIPLNLPKCAYGYASSKV